MSLDTHPSSAAPPCSPAEFASWLAANPSRDAIDSIRVRPYDPRRNAAPAAAPASPATGLSAAEAFALTLSFGAFTGPRKLVGPQGQELVVDPENNAYYFAESSLKSLDEVLAQPVTGWAPILSPEMKTVRAALPAQSLERLRWYAGLIATPGTLNRKLNAADGFRLTRWPETERECAKHFRIAKAMLQDAVSIDAIVAASGVERAEVVDYINGSFTSGRLEVVPAKGAANPDNGSRRDGIFARINKPSQFKR